MSAAELKKTAHSFCEEYVNLRLNRILAEIEKIKKDLNSETKSTAGDKHETGRAMLQLEREKLGKQLAEVEKMKKVLNRVAVDRKQNVVGLGSLVKTELAWYFIAVSAGLFTNGSTKIYCISTASPIGKLLLGKVKGDAFAFNNNSQTIQSVF